MSKSTTKSKVGIEPDDEFLLKAPEVSLFVAAQGMVNQIRGLQHALKLGEIANGAFMEQADAVLVQLAKAVAATERFDIVLPVMGSGQFSPFFWRWFNWWEDYFKELTATQVEEIERLGREGSLAPEAYRPTGRWLGYRHTPAFASGRGSGLE